MRAVPSVTSTQAVPMDEGGWFVVFEWLLTHEQPYWLSWPHADEPRIVH